MARLTKRTIDAAEAGPSTRFLWCGELRGFGLRITSAAVRSFVLRYRNAAGRDRMLTIGRYGVLTVDQARDDARRLLVEVATGSDPAGEKQAFKKSASVNDLLDKYISEHVSKLAASTQTEVKRLVDKHIRPELGKLKAVDLKRSDAERLHRAMRGTPRNANHVLALLSKACALAEIWGLREEGRNPCRGIKRFEEIHRERFLAPDELKRLGKALEEAATAGLPWVVKAKGPTARHLAKPENRRSPVNADALALVRFLLLSGARLSEGLKLRWTDVDPKAGTIGLPERKGGHRRAHPVSAAALAVVAAQPHPKGANWVFPSPSGPDKPLSKSIAENTWQRLRAHVGLDDVRLHDLRHTVGTAAGRSGANAFLVRDMLRHSNVTMTHRYVNRDIDPLRALSDRIGEELSSSLSPPPPSPARIVTEEPT